MSTPANDLAAIQRLRDLVRQQRAELHQADLITDDEYAELCSDAGSVARLESYDDIRARLEAAESALRGAREALENIANMPKYDQDDEHRLRHMGKVALAALPKLPEVGQ